MTACAVSAEYRCYRDDNTSSVICSQGDEDVPTFVWLLFARDSSETPEKLLLNHINPIGDSGGLEMVRACLSCILFPSWSLV